MPRSRGAAPYQRTHARIRSPRGHWLLVSLMMLVIVMGLLAEGYTHGVLGESSSTVAQAPRAGPPAPAAVANGGPVIDATGGRLAGYSMPSRAVALTFDDGPDPAWTPKILAILRHYHVPATFFVVGAHAASYPGLVRDELRDGDEVGSHTYTHLNLTRAGWREPLELTPTQHARARAAGGRTSLLRPPDSRRAPP